MDFGFGSMGLGRHYDVVETPVVATPSTNAPARSFAVAPLGLPPALAGRFETPAQVAPRLHAPSALRRFARSPADSENLEYPDPHL